MDMVHFIPEGQRKLAVFSANSDSPALIRGATGAGKGTIAAWIHAHSARSARPLVYFTPSPQSTLQDWVQSIKSAQGGTWVAENLQIWNPTDLKKLESIARTKSLQHESLRILTQVRIIATCMGSTVLSESLLTQFGSDIIVMPNLKDRKKDFPRIAAALISEIAQKQNKGFITDLNAQAYAVLDRYDWPGNVRELKQVLSHAIAAAKAPLITTQDLPPLFTALSMGLVTNLNEVPPLEKSIS